MNDTSLAAENKLFEMMRQKTESERFFMSASMFDMARSITRAAIEGDNPDISPAEARAEFFRRWYGDDFDAGTREKILHVMRLIDSPFG